MPRPARTPDNLGRYKCPDCEEWKFKDEYFHNKRAKTGLSTYCKVCHTHRQAKYTPAAKKRKRMLRELDATHHLVSSQLEVEAAIHGEGPPGAVWVDGLGWCMPVAGPPQPALRELPKHAEVTKVLRHSYEAVPEKEREAIKRVERELSTLTDDELRTRVAFAKPWEVPDEQQTPTDKVLLAEYLARFASKEETAT